MTPNALIAQLREKAAVYEATTDGLALIDRHREWIEIASPANLTAILDAFDEMREALRSISEFKPSLRGDDPYQQIAVQAKQTAHTTLARLDAEIGGGKHES